MVSRSQSRDHSAGAFLFDRVAGEKPRKLADLRGSIYCHFVNQFALQVSIDGRISRFA
jgi:hypothetical protein